MDLSIITVTYRSKEYIADCILSVVASTLVSYEHIIVDNHSDDETARYIEDHFLSYVTLIKSDRNLGFSAANNLALQKARGRYILYLNPDMQIYQGRLDELIYWMDRNPRVGLASCQLLSYAGTCGSPAPHHALRPIHFLTPFPCLFYFLGLQNFRNVLRRHYSYSQFDDQQEQEVDHIRGAFLLTRKEITEKLGFAFDPRYYLLIEDVDLCREVKQLGYQIVYTPLVSAIDFYGRSFKTKNLLWGYLQLAKSLRRYFLKWHSPLHQLWIFPAMTVGLFLKSLYWLFRKAKPKIDR